MPALVRERVGTKLEVYGYGLRAFPTFFQPRRAVAASGPQAAALPAIIGIVDAPVEAFGVEAHWIGHAQHDHLPILHRNQTIVQVAGGHRHVFAESERVVLIHPSIIARLGAVVADALETWAGVLIERPAFWTVIAGCLRPVERTLAFPPVETRQVAARQRRPHYTLFVDVGAADAESR